MENEVAKVKLVDGTVLDVLAIRGGMEFVQNANRDVLTFEVSPSEATVEKLISIFQNKDATKKITFLDDSNNIIGEAINYTLYLSSGNRMQETPGIITDFSGTAQEEINFAKVGQLTHTEYLLEQILAGR